MTVSTELEDGYRLGREAAGEWPAAHYSLFSLRGEDRLEWLQGQATNDVSKIGSVDSIGFCLCEPTGQILSLHRAWQHEDAILVGTDSPYRGHFWHRTQDMVILEDVQPSIVSDRLRFRLCIQGPNHKSVDPGRGLCLPHDRSGHGGLDVWSEANAIPTAQLPLIPPEAAEALRIEAGIPQMGSDINPKTLPSEMGPAFEREYVSYTKGCYVGQEVLMRMHSRGHANRRWVGLVTDREVGTGDQVSHKSREKAGVITSAALSPRLGPIAAAMLRIEAATPGDYVSVATQGGAVRARVVDFPMI